MNNDKKLSIPLLIIIIAELILCFVVYAYKHNRPTQVVQVQQAPQQTTPAITPDVAAQIAAQTQPATVVAQPDIMLGAKTFTIGGFRFSYPKNLSLSQMPGSATVHHSVSYLHTSTCNENGQARQVPDIADVNITFSVAAKDIKAAMGEVDPAVLSAYSAGALDGYRVAYGTPGCGGYWYYFPITAKKTLVVKRVIPSEFFQFSPLANAAVRLPGVIGPEAEDQIFTAILSSKK